MKESERFLEEEVVGGVHVVRMRAPRLEDETALLVLEDVINNVLEQRGGRHPKVLLNLGSIEYIITTALAKLLSYRTKFLDKGGQLNLCSLQPAVEEVMKITHFDRIFTIFTSEADALTEMQRRPGRGRS
jgi:anti-anti-sigma factor